MMTVVSLLPLVAVLTLSYSGLLAHLSTMMVVLIIVLVVLVLYGLIFMLMRKYVFNQLETIYRFINNTKAGKPASPKKLDRRAGIGDVQEDVMAWAADTEKRIETLVTLENYRKNFVGNVSHELKTPIFSIQGYLHTLLDGGIYDEKINLQYLKRAAKNADRLQRIVEDLESISKLESGRLLLSFEKFDLKALVAEILQDLELKASHNAITLSLSTDRPTAMMVNGDMESIRQVLINLIMNSIKYGKEGGRTTVNLYQLDQNMVIEVEDNGLGIDAEHIPHLFDRFYRVDRGRSRAQGGSGLGLSIVKHILEAHDQNISVRSAIGEGSTFTFTLEKA